MSNRQPETETSNHQLQSMMSSSSCLVARHLDIGYHDEVVVADITFGLSCGQSLALVGVNGSGKSTLLKTIVGLLPPIRGEISVLGAAPGKAPQRLAYLSQFHASGLILPLRVIDVVRMGRFTDRGLFGRLTQEDEDLVRHSMQRMRIENLRDMPLRLLSGGQQQRVYLAQALARQADLLVMDEPTAGLDAVGRELFSQVIKEEVERGAMVVNATHDIQQAAECDQALLLNREVVAAGASREILTPEALLRTFGIVLMGDSNSPCVGVVERDCDSGHDHTASSISMRR